MRQRGLLKVVAGGVVHRGGGSRGGALRRCCSSPRGALGQGGLREHGRGAGWRVRWRGWRRWIRSREVVGDPFPAGSKQRRADELGAPWRGGEVRCCAGGLSGVLAFGGVVILEELEVGGARWSGTMIGRDLVGWR